jgi:hypothetical protein
LEIHPDHCFDPHSQPGGGQPGYEQTEAQYSACGYEKLDDYHGARALCINISEDDARKECFDTSWQELADGKTLCREQRAQRLNICGEIGVTGSSTSMCRRT